jgi:hypothetical protein
MAIEMDVESESTRRRQVIWAELRRDDFMPPAALVRAELGSPQV